MNIPADLKYSEEHEWVRVSGGVATIGITDHAQNELGEIVYVEIETMGDTLPKNEIFGTIEAVKTTSDLFMPISGEVLEFNEDIDEAAGDNPGLINEDPYNKGWIIKVKMSDPTELEDLLSPEEYSALIS